MGAKIEQNHTIFFFWRRSAVGEIDTLRVFKIMTEEEIIG